MAGTPQPTETKIGSLATFNNWPRNSHVYSLGLPTPSPVPQIRPVNRRHCALYEFIHLLNLLTYIPIGTINSVEARGRDAQNSVTPHPDCLV